MEKGYIRAAHISFFLEIFYFLTLTKQSSGALWVQSDSHGNIRGYKL